MSSLIPDSEKILLQNAFDSVHSTFARPIYYFKEAQTVVLQTSPSFNSIYGQQNNAVNNPLNCIYQVSSKEKFMKI